MRQWDTDRRTNGKIDQAKDTETERQKHIYNDIKVIWARGQKD